MGFPGQCLMPPLIPFPVRQLNSGSRVVVLHCECLWQNATRLAEQVRVAPVVLATASEVRASEGERPSDSSNRMHEDKNEAAAVTLSAAVQEEARYTRING